MKLLLVHNFYGTEAPSGENQAVQEEAAALRSAGHEVIEHFTHSDTVRGRGLIVEARTALQVPWNREARAKVRRLLAVHAPDVMHVHNVFPLQSPAIFGAATDTTTAVVNTLHNYRIFCAGALLLRDGGHCTRCLEEQSVLPAIRFGCYRNSRLATLPMAASVALHRSLGTYQRHVDAFIAFTRFQKKLLVEGGLPEERIYLRPNALFQTVEPVPWQDRELKAVFIGRLSSEKGVATLVKAWRSWGSAAPTLEIIGDGPDKAALHALVGEEASARIRLLGQLPREETHKRLSTSRLLVLPSICIEGSPLVLREAFALGVPVAASRLGPLEEFVLEPARGVCFPPGNPRQLLDAVQRLWTDQHSMAHSARAEFLERYSAGAGLAQLETIYGHAIRRKRSQPLGRP
jgi:glycosyltransferase involved in cell wall biosynthesis